MDVLRTKLVSDKDILCTRMYEYDHRRLQCMGFATGRARGALPPLNLKHNFIMGLAPPKFLEKQVYIVASPERTK